MNGFSMEAFRDWWITKGNGLLDFFPHATHYEAAYHAWAAALEWYESQQRLLDELASSNAADQSDIQEL